MPDVHFRYNRSIYIKDPQDFQALLAIEIASQMDCLNDDAERVEHDPKTQIYFPVFEYQSGRCDALVTIDIVAYDWANRLLGIDKKLAHIAAWVRDVLDLGPNTVAVQFIPIPVGCWAKA